MASGYRYIKSNPEKLQKERERVKKLNNDRYNQDQEYRLKRIEYAKSYYQKRKNDLRNLTDNDV
jgi:hypothetical protein